jgi:hypothetical protein
MEDQGTAMGLIAVGIVCLIAIGYANQVTLEKIQVLSPAVTEKNCERGVTGKPLYSQPTSMELCDKLKDAFDNSDEGLCRGYPEEKREACTQMMVMSRERTIDCITYMLRKETKYSQGYPEVEAYCDDLRK